jgi:hypothetical protein
MHSANDVRQTEIHTNEPSCFEVENLKKCKLPGTDQILAEFIQAVGKTLHYEIHKLNSGTRKSCHSAGRNMLLYLFIKMTLKLSSKYLGITVLSATYKILSSILLSV